MSKDCIAAKKKKLYCKVRFSNVTEGGACWGGVSQYTRVYCDLRFA